MNTNKLKGKIIEKGLNIGKTAELMGINKSSLYRKLNNYEKMTIGEVEKLKDILNLSDLEALKIFLN